MGRKKCDVQLPDWFSKTKYYGEDLISGIKKFTLEDWYIQIKRRLDALEDHDPNSLDNDDEGKSCAQKLRDIWNAPLGPYSNNDLQFSKLLWNMGGVSIASPIDLEQLKKLWGYRNRAITTHELFHAPIEHLVDQDSFSQYKLYDVYSRSALLTIDLKRTDAHLIEDFKSILSALRNRKPWNGIIPDPTIKKIKFEEERESWVYYGVLPYWDLRAWEKSLEKERRITLRQMANEIFTEQMFTSDEIRKCTVPIANRIFNYDYLQSLYIYIKRRFMEDSIIQGNKAEI